MTAHVNANIFKVEAPQPQNQGGKFIRPLLYTVKPRFYRIATESNPPCTANSCHFQYTNVTDCWLSYIYCSQIHSISTVVDNSQSTSYLCRISRKNEKKITTTKIWHLQTVLPATGSWKLYFAVCLCVCLSVCVGVSHGGRQWQTRLRHCLSSDVKILSLQETHHHPQHLRQTTSLQGTGLTLSYNSQFRPLFHVNCSRTCVHN